MHKNPAKDDSHSRILAAVDLGSNSFHMVVARLSHGQPKVIDRLREMVRLAAGLEPGKQLSEERQQIALDCLARFGERLRDMHADSVRVVGTSTLRRVRRASGFIGRAERCLGHPVEVISGIEEARLIYQGVIHTSPRVDGAQIVIDIGGGSTEVIRGTDLDAEAMESLHIGCVALSRKYFSDGKMSSRRFRRARTRARLEFAPVVARFPGPAPERAIGASGTIRAVQTVIENRNGGDGRITVGKIEELIDEMIAAGNVDRIKLNGLSEQRKPVFPGGVVILLEAMLALGVDRMEVSDGALREGILYDMVGRLGSEDARVRTVRSMEGRFNIDTGQSDRVERTALQLLEHVATAWRLDRDADRQLLSWAARLHEIGLHISLSGYQRHGAYLLENADMPGFSTDEQIVLARLVGAQRGKLNRRAFGGMPRGWGRRAKRLAVLLRLAVLFNRSRADVDLSGFDIRARGRALTVGMPGALSEANPLTWAGLEREARQMGDFGLTLTLVSTD